MTHKPTRILNPRLDPNFKAIFTQDTEDSRKALRSFLSAAIGREVKSATVVNSEIPKVYDAQRGINYDINCIFADGEKAQVEMQSWDEGYAYGKRAEYYAARATTGTRFRRCTRFPCSISGSIRPMNSRFTITSCVTGVTAQS